MSAAIYSLGSNDTLPEYVARTAYRTLFAVKLGQMPEGALAGGVFFAGWIARMARLELERRRALDA